MSKEFQSEEDRLRELLWRIFFVWASLVWKSLVIGILFWAAVSFLSGCGAEIPMSPHEAWGEVDAEVEDARRLEALERRVYSLEVSRFDGVESDQALATAAVNVLRTVAELHGVDVVAVEDVLPHGMDLNRGDAERSEE